MKKIIGCVIPLVVALLALPVCGFGDTFDVVVMVDITWSLSETFGDIEEYLVGTLLSDVLHDGDTFHLLWFSDHPETMITKVVSDATRSGIRTQLAGLRNLQFTLGKYTDLVGAISFLIQFTDKLAPDNKKLIILITDGIHDPSPESSIAKNAQDLSDTYLKQAQEIKKRGWSIHILKIPSDKNKQDTVFLDNFVEQSGGDVTTYTKDQKDKLLSRTVGFAQITFPENLGTVGEQFVIPFSVQNPGQTPVRLDLTGIRLVRSTLSGEATDSTAPAKTETNMGNVNILEKAPGIGIPASESVELKAQVRLPGSMAEGRQTIQLVLEFQGDVRVVGESGSVTITFDKTTPPQLLFVFPFWLLVLFMAGGIILALLVILLIHFMRTRGFHLSVCRTLGADKLSRTARRRRVAHKQQATSARHSFAVEMIVTMQKRHIGARNIRHIPRGKALSVGGGRSAFLIFLVPVPRRMACIGFDGKSFTFTPVKRDFFPDVTGEIRDCLDKMIPAVSKKGFPLEIYFRRYISPIEEINMIFQKFREQA